MFIEQEPNEWWMMAAEMLLWMISEWIWKFDIKPRGCRLIFIIMQMQQCIYIIIIFVVLDYKTKNKCIIRSMHPFFRHISSIAILFFSPNIFDAKNVQLCCQLFKSMNIENHGTIDRKTYFYYCRHCFIYDIQFLLLRNQKKSELRKRIQLKVSVNN